MDLKSKEWGKRHHVHTIIVTTQVARLIQVQGYFLVDELEEIKWDDSALDNLVLPDDDKQLAWEFVESKAHGHIECDDFIPEKGGHALSPSLLNLY